MRDFLESRLAEQAPVATMLADGRFVTQAGWQLTGQEPCQPNMFVWFHRDLRDEPEVPFPAPVLYRDERIVVVDKPHFLATIPRGQHVLQSVVVRLRDELGLPELGAAHRLDRLTAGVLLLTTQRRWRAPYQRLFERQATRKTYEALAPLSAGLQLPATVRSHIQKYRGNLQAVQLADAAPNAETLIELVETRGRVGRYRLTPRTGKTHQLRVHLNSLGIPILGDPLYPAITDMDVDNFDSPLELVARTLEFTDPVDETPRRFTSEAALNWSTTP